ncbi:hypothetical protein QTP86_016133 [Hemibagrus guttatus]|nr:hypothetical protein QTP86_016133 [Hemibagrus guttatus]
MTSTAKPQSRMTSTAEPQDQATSTAEQQLRATSTAEHSPRATSTDERRLRGDDVRLAGVWNSPRGGRAGAGCCRNSPPLATDLIQHWKRRLASVFSACCGVISVTAVDNQPIGEGLITHVTAPLILQVGLLHFKEVSFHRIVSPKNPIILGFPWLRCQIDWKERELTCWSSYCRDHCLRKVLTSPCHATSVKSPASMVEILIPQSTAMEEYIEEALAAGYIRPSTSPAAASFFFVRNSYSLPLVPVALEQLTRSQNLH